MAAESKFAVKPQPGHPSPEEMTEALVQYILKNDEKKIRALLSQGANANASDSKGNTLLVIAATDPREHKALDAILTAKPDPDLPGRNGKLALHSVLRMKDDRLMPATVEKLLTAGADPNKIETREGQPPRAAFHIAIENNRGDAVLELLLKAGADPSLGEDAAAKTLSPLHALARLGRYGLLETAKNCGVNIDKPDYSGLTPLMWAAREGAAKTVETLLQCGADPTLKDHAGLDAAAHAKAAPPDTDMRPLIQMMARAAKDRLILNELTALRAEVEELRRAVKSKGS